jgi:hypothetical protein
VIGLLYFLPLKYQATRNGDIILLGKIFNAIKHRNLSAGYRMPVLANALTPVSRDGFLLDVVEAFTGKVWVSQYVGISAQHGLSHASGYRYLSREYDL